MNIHKINITGRRWFDRINGNTYHSVHVAVDDNTVAVKNFEYGYNDAYVQTAAEMLHSLGYIEREIHPNGSSDSLWQICRNSNVELKSSVRDVLKRNLRFTDADIGIEAPPPGTVSHWKTFSAGEVNFPDKHAKCLGIEFFAFPYQPYMARKGFLTATISQPHSHRDESGEMIHVYYGAIYEPVQRENGSCTGDTVTIFHIGLPDLDELILTIATEMHAIDQEKYQRPITD